MQDRKSKVLKALEPAYEWLDVLRTCLVVCNEAGVIEWVNSSTQTLFERSFRSFLDVDAGRLFDDEEGFQQAFQAVLEQRIESVVYIGTIAKLPTQIVSVHVSLMSDQTMILELHPIEQQTITERSERLAREIEIYQETFRNLAHEVKNPLGGLRGAAQLLEMELENSEHHEYTRVIISEADRLQRLVDRLIRPSQGSLERSQFNIHEVCEHVFALIRAEFHEKLLLQRDYDASLPEIEADKEKLVQAYLNLCRNAVQSVLSMESLNDPKIVLRTRILNCHFLLNKLCRYVVVLSVLDNGSGVPAHLSDRVFHPLVTGRADGTGLGLSLAQELIRQHGGLIEFDSTPGKTEFRILLPMGEA